MCILYFAIFIPSLGHFLKFWTKLLHFPEIAKYNGDFNLFYSNEADMCLFSDFIFPRIIIKQTSTKRNKLNKKYVFDNIVTLVLLSLYGNGDIAE